MPLSDKLRGWFHLTRPVQTLQIPASGFPEVPGYRLESELGRGGMACVYRARQLRLDRPVALKLLHAGSAAERAALTRFASEARLIAKLEHPKIVAVYDVGQCKDGSLFYTMPLLSGGDLRGRVGQLSEAQSQEVIDSVLEALAHAHEHGVVHRDVKPENVLFNRDGLPLLADFGVALTLQTDNARLTTEGTTVGSATYMSPEQARGGEVDARSDLYSVGIMAWELLTGKPPFEGQHWLDTLLAHQEQAIPRLPEPWSHWQAWLDRALAKLPSERFQSAHLMRSALPRNAASRNHDGAKTQAMAAIGSAPHAGSGRHVRAMLAVIGVLLLSALGYWVYPKGISVPEVRARMADGHWFTPPQANAWDGLQALETDAQTTAALQSAFVQGMGSELQAQLARRDWATLARDYPLWHRAVAQFAHLNDPGVIKLEALMDQTVLQTLEAARASYQRISDPSWAEFLAARPNNALWAELAGVVAALPESTESFAEPIDAETSHGLRLLQAPTPSQPGWAVSLEPVSSALAGMAAIKNPDCAAASKPTPPEPPKPSPACLTLEQSRTLAEWMSKRTGNAYRLPTPDEIKQVAAKAQSAATGQRDSRLAWTSECRWVTEVRRGNVAQRSLGAVKQFFGARNKPNTRSYCDGQLVASLTTGETQSVAADVRRPDLVVMLVRRIDWPKVTGK